jgi:hypothetical protein
LVHTQVELAVRIPTPPRFHHIQKTSKKKNVCQHGFHDTKRKDAKTHHFVFLTVTLLKTHQVQKPTRYLTTSPPLRRKSYILVGGDVLSLFHSPLKVKSSKALRKHSPVTLP